MVGVRVGQEDAPQPQRVEVQIGRRVPGLVEIKSGLAAGQRVVIDGATLIPPGGLVKVLREEAPEAPGKA